MFFFGFHSDCFIPFRRCCCLFIEIRSSELSVCVPRLVCDTHCQNNHFFLFVILTYVGSGLGKRNIFQGLFLDLQYFSFFSCFRCVGWLAVHVWRSFWIKKKSEKFIEISERISCYKVMIIIGCIIHGNAGEGKKKNNTLNIYCVCVLACN